MSSIRRIRSQVMLATRRRVTGRHLGQHSSGHSGDGIDFNDLREYIAGDSVSDIDWRASARHGGLLVKRHFERRSMTLVLVVATGSDMAGMATPTTPKKAVMLEAAGTLGVVATNHGDRVAMVWWDEGGPKLSAPSKRNTALELGLRNLAAACTPDNPAADVPALLDLALGGLRQPGVVAVITDDIGCDPAFLGRLRRLSARHEVMVLTVSDLDPTVPAAAESGVHSATSLQPLQFLADPTLRTQVHAHREARAQLRKEAFADLGIPHLELDSVEETIGQIVQLLGRRHRAR